MISGALCTVAGLCGDHHVYLLDENIEGIDWPSLRNYDIVGVTGMTVQKRQMRQILLKLRGKAFQSDVFASQGGDSRPPLVSPWPRCGWANGEMLKNDDSPSESQSVRSLMARKALLSDSPLKGRLL
jgi:hypothetical protein